MAWLLRPQPEPRARAWGWQCGCYAVKVRQARMCLGTPGGPWLTWPRHGLGLGQSIWQHDMRILCGTYAECARGATGVAGRQPSPPTHARLGYAQIVCNGATWGNLALNLGRANAATRHAGTVQNICGTYAEHMRDPRKATGLVGCHPLPSNTRVHGICASRTQYDDLGQPGPQPELGHPCHVA